MSQKPKRLHRPLVILSGWFDPGFAVSQLKLRIDRVIQDERVVVVSFASCKTFDDCRKKVVDAVNRAFPSDDSQWTAEVDVIAVSMGGLVARYAQADRLEEKRLRINRLFTIATPHRGAGLAHLPTLNRLQIDMRPGSEFMTTIATSPVTYKIYPYVRLGDVIVGESNAAPPGENPWWVPNAWLEPAHLLAYKAPRILADIARRLRDEPPFVSEPREPLPAGDG